MEGIRALGLSGKAVTILFICLHALIIVLMIACLNTPTWVEMKDDSLDSWSFTGSMSKITDGFGEFEGDSYRDVREYFCELHDDMSYVEYYEAMCALFGTLAACCCYFCMYEFCAVMSVIATIVFLSLNFATLSFLWVPFITVTVGEFMHFFGLLFYLGLNNITFDGDCDTLYNGNTPGNLCARDGPNLIVAIFVLYFVIGVALCVASGMMISSKRGAIQIPIPVSGVPAYPGIPGGPTLAYPGQPQYGYPPQAYPPGAYYQQAHPPQD